MSKKRTKTISIWKVILAICTCGISLIFVGIKKNKPSRKRSTKATAQSSLQLKWLISKKIILSVLIWFLFTSLFLKIDGTFLLSKKSVWFSWMFIFLPILFAIFLPSAILKRNRAKVHVGGKSVAPCDGKKPKEVPEPCAQKAPAKEKAGAKKLSTIQKIDAMNGHEFEYFVADLLRRLDYINVEVTKGSGDQGVDVLAEKAGIRYAIQCKKYSQPLGNTPVQEIAAGKDFYNCHIGVVITNNYFTAGGKELANRVRILLWDRDELQRMIHDANL